MSESQNLRPSLFWLAAGLALTAVFSLVISLPGMHLTAPDRTLSTPAECAFPCWQGIRPGFTTNTQAAATLRRHPWVERLWGISVIRWTWSGQQPEWIDASRPGTLSSHYGIVEQIGIPTRLRMGDFWLMYGGLEKGIIFASGRAGLVNNFVDVGADQLWIMTDLTCPIRAPAFWHAPALILLGDMSTFERLHLDDYDDYRLSGWFHNVSC